MKPPLFEPNHPGIVIKKNLGSYGVLLGNQVILCTLASDLQKKLIYSSNKPGIKNRKVVDVENIHHDPVAIGDQVDIEMSSEGAGKIVEIKPRRNRLARRSAVPMPAAHPFEQVIAANIDRVMAVFAAAQPAPKWNLLDRYLVSAESLGIPSSICITKMDLARHQDGLIDQNLEICLQEYRKIGYPVFLTSTLGGEGITEIRKALIGQITVLVGKSGVGKTSLLNVLQPSLTLRVGEVNQITGKGRHTTSWAEMFLLEEGGAIIDTPGVREFGLWDIAGEDLASYFPEMRPFLGKCRFGSDCRHEEEPGCAIRKAVMNGEIHPRRYQSYLLLKEEGYFYD